MNNHRSNRSGILGGMVLLLSLVGLGLADMPRERGEAIEEVETKLATAVRPGDPSLLPAIRKAYRLGQLRSAEEHYKASLVLSTSKEEADLQLAHDLGLVALESGFSPAFRTIRSAHARILESMGVKLVRPSDTIDSGATEKDSARTGTASPPVVESEL